MCIRDSNNSMPYIKKLSEIVPGDGSGWELSDSGSYVYHFTYSHAAGDSVDTDHTYTVKLYTSSSAAAPGTVTDNGEMCIRDRPWYHRG